MSQRDASRKRRKARPSAGRPEQAADAGSRAVAPGDLGFPEDDLPAGAAAEHAQDGAPVATRAKRTREERRADRAADREAAAAHRRAAALATAGGPIAPAADPDAPARPSRSARTEAKNEAVRQSLEPLPLGERPPWVTYAALLSIGLGLLNVVLYAVGVRTATATFGATVLVGLILIVCGAGMWKAIYQAVLAFEVLLGITLTFAAISLIAVNSWGGLVRSLVFLVVPGVFFWKLIRAMARLQMPERPGQPPRR